MDSVLARARQLLVKDRVVLNLNKSDNKEPWMQVDAETMVYNLHDPLPIRLHRWKRVYLQLENQDKLTHLSLTQLALEELRVRTEKEAWDAYNRARGSNPTSLPVDPKQENRTGKVKTKEIWHKFPELRPASLGQPLKPSTCQPRGGWSCKVETCPHPKSELGPYRANGRQKWYTCLKCGQRWEAVFSREQIEMVAKKTKEGSLTLLDLTPIDTVREMSASSNMTAPGAFQWCEQAYKTLMTLGFDKTYAVQCMMDSKDSVVDKAEIHKFVRSLATREANQTNVEE